MIKKIAAAAAVMLALCLGAVPQVHAYRDTGSVSVALEEGVEGTDIEAVEFELIKVADLNDGIYTFTEEFADKEETIDLNAVETSEKLQETAIALSEMADEKNIEGDKLKTDEKGFLKFEDLEVAVYLLRPSDYAHYEFVLPTVVSIPTYTEGVQNSMEFDVKVTPKHTPVKVEISKQDITTSRELEGAHLVVKDMDGNIRDEWVSGKEPHMINNLYCNESYTLTETIAPRGYKIAQTVTFTVEPTGEVQKVVMYDELMPVTKVKTGDNNDMIILSLVCVSALAGIIIFRKRKHN